MQLETRRLIASVSIEELDRDGDDWKLKVIKGSEISEFKLGRKGVPEWPASCKGGAGW